MTLAGLLRVMLAGSLLAPLLELDSRVQSAVQVWRPVALERPMQIATELGNPRIVLGAFLVIAAFGGPGGAAVARHAIVAFIPTNLIVDGVKRATFRARPDGEHKRSNASFPSSHAANAFAIAYVFSREWRRGAIFCFVVAAVIAFSRMFLNRHFLSDVVVGAGVGVACAWGAEILLRRFPMLRGSPKNAQQTT